MSGDSLGNSIMRLLIAGIIGIVAISVVASTGAYLGQGSASVLYPTSSPKAVDHSIHNIPDTVRVDATTGNALLLEGGTIESSGPTGFDESNWAVCATGALGDANLNATYDLVAYNSSRILIQYDAGQWSAYYSNGTQDAKATVPAVTPTSLTPVCARFDNTTGLQVTAEGNWSSQVNLTSAASPRNVSLNWSGRIDEVHMYGNASSNTTLNSYLADPVEPRPEADRVARLMLDEGRGQTTYIYWLDQDASLVGTVSWSSNGLTGPSLSGGPAFLGGDYQLSDSPFSISVSGYLSGAPIVYVDWEGAGPFAFDFIGIVILMIALLVLIVFARRVIAEIDSSL